MRGYECSCTWIAVPWTFGFCVRQACSEFSAAQFRRVSVLAVLFRLVQCSVPPSQTLAFAWQARRSVPPSCISFCAASVRSASVASIAALWTNPAELLLGVCLPLKNGKAKHKIHTYDLDRCLRLHGYVFNYNYDESIISAYY